MLIVYLEANIDRFIDHSQNKTALHKIIKKKKSNYSLMLSFTFLDKLQEHS